MVVTLKECFSELTTKERFSINNLLILVVNEKVQKQGSHFGADMELPLHKCSFLPSEYNHGI